MIKLVDSGHFNFSILNDVGRELLEINYSEYESIIFKSSSEFSGGNIS